MWNDYDVVELQKTTVNNESITKYRFQVFD